MTWIEMMWLGIDILLSTIILVGTLLWLWIITISYDGWLILQKRRDQEGDSP